MQLGSQNIETEEEAREDEFLSILLEKKQKKALRVSREASVDSFESPIKIQEMHDDGTTQSPILKIADTVYRPPKVPEMDLELSQMDSLGMVAQDYQNLLQGETDKNCPVVHPKKYIINDLLDRKGFANHSQFPKGTTLRSNRKIASERG